MSPSQNGPDLRVAKNDFFGLVSGEQFAVVQKEVAEMLKGRILVGHALHNDLKVLPFRATLLVGLSSLGMCALCGDTPGTTCSRSSARHFP